MPCLGLARAVIIEFWGKFRARLLGAVPIDRGGGRSPGPRLIHMAFFQHLGGCSIAVDIGNPGPSGSLD